MIDNKKISEQELINKIKEGDYSSFELLFYQYNKKILNFIYIFVNNSEDAEDITQETFLKFYNIIHRLNKVNVKSYLYKIAVNSIKNHFRKQKHRNFVSLFSSLKFNNKEISIEDSKFISDVSLQPDKIYEKESLENKINKQVNSLPLKYKTPLILYYYDNLSYHDIAQILGTTKKAVERSLARARIALKKAFKLHSEL